MPVRKANFRRTNSYRSVKGRSTDVVLTAVQPNAPGASLFTLTPSGAGGTLASATYTYAVSVVVNGIESGLSPTQNAVVTGPTGSVLVDATALIAAYPKASAWKLYGRTTQLFMVSTNLPTATVTDTGSVTPSGAAIPNDGRVSFRNRMTKVTQTAVPQATGAKQTTKYYGR